MSCVSGEENIGTEILEPNNKISPEISFERDDTNVINRSDSYFESFDQGQKNMRFAMEERDSGFVDEENEEQMHMHCDESDDDVINGDCNVESEMSHIQEVIYETQGLADGSECNDEVEADKNISNDTACERVNENSSAFNESSNQKKTASSKKNGSHLFKSLSCSSSSNDSDE